MSACDCWIEDVWRFVHTSAQISQLTTIREKEAYVCTIGALNRIISCEPVRMAVDAFMKEFPFADHCSSNNSVFFWTVLLRQTVHKLLGKPELTLAELNEQYNPKRLTKDVWGPITWKALHIVTLCAKPTPVPGGAAELTRSLRATVKAFVTCVTLLLPCGKCRKHAWEYCSTHSIDDYLANNLHAFQWVVEFHNSVNKRLNETEGYSKPLFTPMQALVHFVNLPEGGDYVPSFKPMRLD